MSLNNIELGDLVVSELYRDSLLATEAAPAKVTPTFATTAPRTAAPVTTAFPAVPRPASPAVPTPGTPVTPGPGTIASAIPTSASRDTGASAPPVPGPGALASLPSVSAPDATTGYKFLGNNRRKIVVLVQSPGVAFLPDDQLNFLTRMLEACKMNVGDVAIVNLANTSVTITALKQQLQPSVILLFGMEPVQIRLPMNFPWFKIQAYDDCTYLCAPSLEELVQPGEESKLPKSKLWMCLKTLFEI